jgi:hypothetical protein
MASFAAPVNQPFGSLERYKTDSPILNLGLFAARRFNLRAEELFETPSRR